MVDNIRVTPYFFNNFLTGISLVNKYAKVKFEKEQYSCNIVNPSGFYMGEFKVKQLNELEEPLLLNLDILKVLSIIPSKGEEFITISHDNNRLSVTVGASRYKMSTVVDAEIPKQRGLPENMMKGNHIQVDSNLLYKACKDVYDFAEFKQLFFHYEKGNLTIHDPDETAAQDIRCVMSDSDKVYATKLSGELVLPIVEFMRKSSPVVSLNVLNESPVAIWNDYNIFAIAPMIDM